LKQKPVIVVGGGLAGLRATMKIAEKGVPVLLFSLCPVKRSHSVCAQGGINAAVNVKGEGDSVDHHFYDTVYGGDFLANQTPIKGMCEAAPSIIYLLDRMGVMFSRTSEGFLEFRRFGGTLFHRTAFAGATTGQQILYALDEQVRRAEADGRVRKFENHEFISCVLDEDNVCHGITAVDRNTMEVNHYEGSSVILATGGLGTVFGKSTNSIVNTGSAASIAYQQGAVFANGEFIQVHPTAIPGTDKLRLISESVRGEGGRVWTYKDGKPWYFLEEWYPKYGNLVPRDIAARAIFKVCQDMNLGIDGENMVYLDISHLPEDLMEEKLGGVLEIYRKFMGEDPHKVPMRVFPGVHYSMGGLWVDDNLMTNIPGLFAAGECNYQYHGANRLGANSLLSCIYDGTLAGDSVLEYARHNTKDVDSRLFSDDTKLQSERLNSRFKLSGTDNVYRLSEELGELMSANVTIIRDNATLQRTDEQIVELKSRAKDIGINDHSRYANHEVLFIDNFRNMLELARVITLGALSRNESRGAHFKPEFPERDDENWLKTTRAQFEDDKPVLSYEDVDTGHYSPVPRQYDVDE